MTKLIAINTRPRGVNIGQAVIQPLEWVAMTQAHFMHVRRYAGYALASADELRAWLERATDEQIATLAKAHNLTALELRSRLKPPEADDEDQTAPGADRLDEHQDPAPKKRRARRKAANAGNG